SVRRQAWKRWCTQILSALSPIRAEREEPRNLHFFPPEYGGESGRSPLTPGIRLTCPDLLSPFRGCRWHCRGHLLFWDVCTGGTNPVVSGPLPANSSHPTCTVPSPCLTLPCPQMAVLEIQANGDTRVTEEAIARARHSLSDPNMRVSSWPCPNRLALSVPRRAGAVIWAGLEVQQEFILSCLARDPARRPSAHSLLFHRVLFEVHSLKLLAAHCFIQHQCEGQAGLGKWDLPTDELRCCSAPGVA
ncbi:hypothetical protein E2I00_010730, partial [Balaenoptera physalus]